MSGRQGGPGSGATDEWDATQGGGWRRRFGGGAPLLSVAGMRSYLATTYGRGYWAACVYGLWVILGGLAGSVAVFLSLAAGVVTSIVWIGVPLVLTGLLLSRLHLSIDLRLQRRLFGREVAAPAWPGNRELSAWAHVRLLLRDRVTWAAIAWSLAGFPLALLWIVGLPLLVLGPLIALTAPVWYTLGIELNADVSSWPRAVVAMGTGVVLVLVCPWVVRGGAMTLAALAATVSRSRQRSLEATIARLRTERDRSLASAEYDRRRLERDLHDAVQPHLTAAMMTLARARVRETTQQPVGPLIEEAIGQMTTGMSELRRLIRGLGPAGIEDVALGTALRNLAVNVPGRLTVHGEADEAPATVRQVAYFVANESITNAVRHGRASDVVIGIARERRDGRSWLTVTVEDNGVGGAALTPGGGIMGLRDRVAALGGNLAVESPPGGPTTVRASIPCEY